MSFEMKPHRLWGEFEDGSDKFPQTPPENIITPMAKVEKLKKLKQMAINVEEKIEEIKLENPLVTQTVEVMNQTEMLQTLIDTYANKNGFNNYLLNPCQMIPQVDFPPENTAELINDDKFAKPVWFIPPIETDFSRGIKQKYSHVNKEICRELIRKAICGLLRVAGFNDASSCALTTLTDSVDEFIKNLLIQLNDVKINEGTDKINKIDILTLEKSYFAMTQNSLLSIHNYFKNDIVSRNRSEINEFNNIYQEYDKMMKESQNIKFREDDLMNFLDFSTGTTVQCSGGGGGGGGGNNGSSGDGNSSVSVHQQNNDLSNVTLMNLLKSENPNNQGNFHDIFQGEVIETQSTSQQDINNTNNGASSSLETWSLKHL